MAKLTLTFRGKPIQTFALVPGENGVGRDSSNSVHIDSLAVAPRHAVIDVLQEGCFIREVPDGLPVFVNDRRVSEHRLQHGDRIDVGKHTLFFSDGQFITDPVAEPAPATPPLYRGSFQVMTGKQIGMVIALKSAVNRLGRQGAGMVEVTRCEEGYRLSRLDDETRVTINGLPVQDEPVLLRDGDMVKINQSLLQFFQEIISGNAGNV